MTTIMNESYGYSYEGIKKYAVNRWLRLFPSYYLVAVATVIILMLVPGTDNQKYIPDSWTEIAANVTMIYPAFYPLEYIPKLSSTTWALTLEIFFYALIALGISRSPRITILWLFLSVLYLIIMNLQTDFAFGIRYGNVLEASLPFAIGATLYHFKRPLKDFMVEWRLENWRLWMGLFIFNQIFVLLSPMVFGDQAWKTGLLASYVNLFLSSGIVLVLFYTTASARWRRLDALMGQFSYPLYLSHPIGAIFGARLYDAGHNIGQDWLSFLTASGLTLLLSGMCVYLIDNNVERLRRRIKARIIST